MQYEWDTIMYYKLKKGCFIREYGPYGYITSTGIYNDQLFNESGKVFLIALTREPQSLDTLTERIVRQFIDVSKEDIVNDVKTFFDNLVTDGFASFGETKTECVENDIGFTYVNEREIKSVEDFSPIHQRSENNSQAILRQQLLKHPQIGSFQIEITSKCNERCIHCYIPHKYKINEMQPDLYYKILDELDRMHVLNVTLSGGEPMTHPYFLKFLKAAKTKDFNVGVLSNLTLLTDEMVEVMKEGNPAFVQVSLYSMNPERHDAVTTIQGSWRKTTNAILKLVENNVPVQISCPVMKANKTDYLEVMEWAHAHKIRSETDYAIMAEYNHDTSNLVNRLSPAECKEILKQLLEADEGYRAGILSDKFENEVEKLNHNEEEPFCGVGISTCCVVANGDVFPCPGWQSMVCGNLSIDTLENVWLNSEKLNYLRSIRRKDIPKCSDCKDKAFCSPCLARFANESSTGNPLEVATHFCEVARVNKEVVMEYLDKRND